MLDNALHLGCTSLYQLSPIQFPKLHAFTKLKILTIIYAKLDHNKAFWYYK